MRDGNNVSQRSVGANHGIHVEIEITKTTKESTIHVEIEIMKTTKENTLKL